MSQKNNESLEPVQVEENEQVGKQVDLSGFLEEEPAPENQEGVQVDSGGDVQVSGIDIVGMGVDLSTAYLVARKGEHWAMAPEERCKLSEIINALAAKYGSSGSVSPEVALIIFGVTFAAPRVLQDMANDALVDESVESDSGGVGDISINGG